MQIVIACLCPNIGLGGTSGDRQNLTQVAKDISCPFAVLSQEGYSEQTHSHVMSTSPDAIAPSPEGVPTRGGQGPLTQEILSCSSSSTDKEIAAEAQCPTSVVTVASVETQQLA